MSNFYPNALNGYTQFYGTSPASNQANTVFGPTGTTMSGGFNALYGYQQQTMGAALPTNQAHRSSSLASSVPSIYSTFVQPSYQSTAAASSAVGFRAGAHGAVGGPVPKPITKPVAPVQLQPGASAYDSLVYNTAAQMIQQQHQAKIASLQPRYQQSKNNKAYGRKPFNKESQLLYCEICKISCAGKQTMQEHMDGQKHKKKEAMMKGENSLSLPRNKVSFRCDLCGVTCTGQDTYEAHIRGSKHQKTVALVRKRGGEVPVEPTIIPPTEYNCQTGLVSPAPLPPPPPPLPSQEPVVGYAPLKRVIGISTVSFVPSTKSTTTSTIDNKKVEAMTAASSAGLSATELAISAQSDDVKAMIAAEASVTPVGESYIESEKDAHGKLIQYICKLCDCKFSDPNAKDIHLKGRRHRLQYKLKVDPKLVVEVKVPPSRRVGGRYGGPARPLPNLLNSIPPWFGPPQGPTRLDRRIDTVDDRHVQIKLLTLDPGVEFLTRTEAIAKNIEAVVKLISDYFGFAEAEEGKEPSRIIQALNRVGIFYDQLLINGDDEIEFICSCLNIPDQKLLFNFSEQFKLLYRSCGNLDKKFTVNVSDPSVIIHFEEAALKVRILLTSKLFREEKTEVPLHALNKEAGLLALAKLRRDKWFGACCQPLCSATPTIRLLRDLKRRRSVWSSLTDWMCMLLVENILSTWQNSLSVGDAFRRVMEAVASGFLSPIFPGLPDPCETGKPNVLDDLSVQQREDLMFDAQAMVRMISFHQIYKVLGIERLPDVRPPLGDSSVGKKRPLDENNGVNDVKKDKRDGEDEETELFMDTA